ncbi:MAG TPA: phosphate ABC transporter substrate-binding protein PstS [Candidatus Lumbricidophila sp.]|nr:phosphate ABC transporter substrate-binding protein PstS [Candidatus Lumbricidophila sp.]
MNLKRSGAAAAIALVAALALSSCAANETDAPAPASTGAGTKLTGTLIGAGSSAQKAAQEAWTAEFQKANPGVDISYDPTGSGAGRTTFIAGGSDFAGSDSALNADELKKTFGACAPDTTAIDLPVYISPIAVIFNIDGVTDLKLDAKTLAGIFKGAITKWNDPAIAALNPDAKLPDAAITAVHRSDDSGTTKNFTDYLFQNAPDVWDAKPADPFPYKTGEGAQGTSGVVTAVTNGKNTIGYADASKAGKLGVAKIKIGETFVGYTAEAAAKVVAESKPAADRPANDLAFSLNRKTTDPTHYPLVLVSYAIVCQQYKDAAKAELVKAYVSYLAGVDGQSVAASAAGAAPLSADLQKKVADALATIK